jgi:protease-4
MKQFFKFMFASMLGFILAGVVLFFIVFIMVVTMVSTMVATVGEKGAMVNSNSVLEIKFELPIKERTSKNPFGDIQSSFGLTAFSSFLEKQELGLNDILKAIAKAKDDTHIKGIMLNTPNIVAGIGTLEEIRNALLDFKKSGKFIYAYNEDYNQATYYLASVADKIFLNPQGSFDMRGLHAELTFFKGALEKLDIEPEIIRHGKFKSAVEPFTNDKMSAENRLQIAELINSIWNHYVSMVAESRSIPEDELKTIAREMKIKFPEDAIKYKLVDQLSYYDEVQSELKKKTGVSEKEKVKMIGLKKYDKASGGAISFGQKKKIAVIYAVGEIHGGQGSDEEIGSEKISETIRKARLDTSIKAIVLRVNSPGGSALASDVIWREIVLAKKVKPVVASMGDVAASGGYYISCAADSIVAEPNTITGSIGVFGLLFNAQKFFNQKLGITFDTVNTGRFGGIGSATRPLTVEEKEI